MTKAEQNELIFLLAKVIKEQSNDITLSDYVINDLRDRLTEAEAAKGKIT